MARRNLMAPATRFRPTHRTRLKAFPTPLPAGPIRRLPGNKAQFYSSPYFSGPMLPYDSHHDQGSKLLFNGVDSPGGRHYSGRPGCGDAKYLQPPERRALYFQTAHPEAGDQQPKSRLCQRGSRKFSTTTAAECAATMKAVVRAILLDPEARRGDDPTQVQSN